MVLLGGLILIALSGFPAIGGSDGTAGDRARTGASAVVPAARAHRFDATKAFALARLQVAAGQRPAGSPQLRRVAEALRRRLPGGRFEAIAGQPGLRNIVGTLPGARPAVVIGAHYDTLAKPPGFVGANNGAAGSAIVVQLARDLRHVKRPAGSSELRFVLFDGEEPAKVLPEETSDFYNEGLRGSRAYAARHASSTRAMLLLDYVANNGLRLPREASSDQGLWSQLRRAASRVGVSAVFPASKGPQITDDHTPFLRAGVPAVDLIDWSYEGHSTTDTLDKLSVRSMDAVGETLADLLVH